MIRGGQPGCGWLSSLGWRGVYPWGDLRREGWPVSAADRDAASIEAADIETARSDTARLADEYEAAGDWRGLADARRRQANIARSSGDLDRAQDYLRAAWSLYIMLDDGYWATRALTSLAEIRLSMGDYVAAAELSGQAVERMPGDTGALTVLAYAEWQAGLPADAEVTFSRVLHWDADTPSALVGRGQIRADLGSYSLALDDLDRAMKFPLDREAEADAHSARALALAGLGRAPNAHAELAESLRLLPGRSRTKERANRIAILVGDIAEPGETSS
jgi:tetratricopeptide (TPR) repeat protein